MTDLSAKPRVLFVCQGSDTTGEIVQVIARARSGGRYEALMAGPAADGSTGADEIPPAWRDFLQGQVYVGQFQRRLPLADADHGTYDAVISLADEELCPWIAGMVRECWPIDCSSQESEFDCHRVAGEVAERIERLAARICAPAQAGQRPGERRSR